MKVWISGLLEPDSKANLSIYSSSINFGDSVFEMQRTYNRRTFKLHEHIERLYASAKYVGIDIPYLPYELYEAYENLLIENRHEFNEHDEIRSLIHVDRGIIPIYKSSGLDIGVKVIIACWPLKWIIPDAYKIYTEGVPAIIPGQRTIPAQLLEPKVKMRSRLHLKMADLEVKRTDNDAWALLLDPDGFIAEGSGSNFFYIKSRELFTPEPRNCLRGISRKYIMELARKLKVEVFERNIEPYDILQADEAFFSNTPYGIVPIISINGQQVGKGIPGRLTKYLMHKWSEDIACDFIGQTKGWNNA